MAWREDEESQNRAVQMSVQGGLHHATVFTSRLPSLVRMWLKDLGNSENHSGTSVTALEKLRSTSVIEHGFDLKKRENGWGVESLGQSVLEQNKRTLCLSV